jgi:hypothetical protein
MRAVADEKFEKDFLSTSREERLLSGIPGVAPIFRWLKAAS